MMSVRPATRYQTSKAKKLLVDDSGSEEIENLKEARMFMKVSRKKASARGGGSIARMAPDRDENESDWVDYIEQTTKKRHICLVMCLWIISAFRILTVVGFVVFSLVLFKTVVTGSYLIVISKNLLEYWRDEESKAQSLYEIFFPSAVSSKSLQFSFRVSESDSVNAKVIVNSVVPLLLSNPVITVLVLGVQGSSFYILSYLHALLVKFIKMTGEISQHKALR
jgi:hypothetical protein